MKFKAQWSESRMTFSFWFVCVPISLVFVGAIYFVTSVEICTMMIEVSSEQSNSQFLI